jgi:Transposase IS66 family
MRAGQIRARSPSSSVPSLLREVLCGLHVEHRTIGCVHLNLEHSERELRREAVGRKNWLFVGSDEGAKWNGTFVSLLLCDQRAFSALAP